MKVLRVALPLACSAILIIWLFKKVDFKNMISILRNNVDYWWFLLVMGIVVLSHVIRGFRWGIQLRGAGVGNVPKMALCCSIFGAYAMNLLVPYMGEAWRIVYIARRQNKPVSTVLGTDLGDRISDAIVVLLLFFLTLIVGHKEIVSFLNKYAVGEKILHVLSDPWLWTGIIGTIGAFCLFIFLNRKKRFAIAIILWLDKVWYGFKILFTMKGRLEYLILTLGIWTCFYLETYVSFFAFPFTRELISEPGTAWGLLPGLISFVFSSITIAIPSNGGLGPWNLAVMFALSLFGIKDADGAAFSIIVWSTVSFTFILLGIFTMFYVLISRRRIRKKEITATPDSTTPLNQKKT